MSDGESSELLRHVATVPLVDHHVHGTLTTHFPRTQFETYLNEGSPDPIPGWMTQFDSQLGFAIRRWCSPLLDLEPHATSDEYWERRQALGTQEVTGRFLRAAGVSDWIVDTGFGTDTILNIPGLVSIAGGRGHEIVRLESLAEQVAAYGVAAAQYPEAFRARLALVTEHAVGVKTILAYRTGFDIDLSRPDDDAVVAAAGRWLGSLESTDATDRAPRIVDPVLIAFGIHAAVDRGLPIQIHVGFGDRDLDLHLANPMLLLGFLRATATSDVPILLLHCYPYHREAGYLAQAFNHVSFDVGLSLNYLGVRSVEVVAESFEMAPFAKQLYSSDGWGTPELHYLGAVLWRRAITQTFGRWVADGDWSLPDALRVVDMVAHQNAQRVYGLA